MDDSETIVRLRGLPWAAKADDVIKFLEGCSVEGGEDGVHIMHGPDGRASGEAYVELTSFDDLKLALTKNKSHMGRRYIDVFKSKRAEMDWAIKHSGPCDTTNEIDAVVRLRGLPYGCSKEEIANFFSGLEIIPNGITILLDQFGRTTGDSFVQFTTLEIVELALQKHKETIGHRYIEVFKSSYDELMTSINRLTRQTGGGFGMGFGPSRPAPGSMDRFGFNTYGNMAMSYGRGRPGRGGVGPGFFNNGFGGFPRYGGGDCAGPGFGGGYGGPAFGHSSGYGGMGARGGRGYGMGLAGRGFETQVGKRPFIGGIMNRSGIYESQTGHSVHMRGLPYSATEDDIAQFFLPLNLVNINLQYNKDGRPSGDADVDFATHEEAVEAMKRHKSLIQKRYIELFLRSSPSGGRSANFRGNNFGNGCLYGGNNYTAF